MIIALQLLKKNLLHQQYVEAFSAVKTKNDLERFISSYQNDDPESLVPKAQKKVETFRQEASDAFKKSLACDPQFIPTSDGKSCSITLANRECGSPRISEAERGRLLDAMSANPEVIVETVMQGIVSSPDNCRLLNHRLQQYKEEIEEAERKADEEKKQKLARTERKSKLKSGQIKIQSFEDAVLVYDGTEEISGISGKPLLDPDHKTYGGAVRLEEREDNGSLRGLVLDENTLLKLAGNPMAKIMDAGTGSQPGLHYVLIRANAKTTYLRKNGLRIGDSPKILGRYVSNVKYRTREGTKTVPVLDAMYIE